MQYICSLQYIVDRLFNSSLVLSLNLNCMPLRNAHIEYRTCFLTVIAFDPSTHCYTMLYRLAYIAPSKRTPAPEVKCQTSTSLGCQVPRCPSNPPPQFGHFGHFGHHVVGFFDLHRPFPGLTRQGHVAAAEAPRRKAPKNDAPTVRSKSSGIPWDGCHVNSPFVKETWDSG